MHDVEDYINNQKASGYRSYHVIVEYPIDTIDGFQIVNAEIQIRTLAMNFWATAEPFQAPRATSSPPMWIPWSGTSAS